MTDNDMRLDRAESCFICGITHGDHEAVSCPSAINRRAVMTGMAAAVSAVETAQPQGRPQPVAIGGAAERVAKLAV